jgi:hypothetical protein
MGLPNERTYYFTEPLLTIPSRILAVAPTRSSAVHEGRSSLDWGQPATSSANSCCMFSFARRVGSSPISSLMRSLNGAWRKNRAASTVRGSLPSTLSCRMSWSARLSNMRRGAPV